LILLYTNFAIGNLQLSVSKLQLLAPNFFNPQRHCFLSSRQSPQLRNGAR